MVGELQSTSTGLIARPLSARERPEALSRLAAAPRSNLLLLDLVAGAGRAAAPSEIPARLIGVWSDAELAGVVALRPSLALDAEMGVEAVDALLPALSGLESGLVKSPERVVTPLWDRLHERGRLALVDRIETAYCVERGQLREVHAPAGARVRPAGEPDLEALVTAARASLREERRPDPFDGDPATFRRWVRGRLHRARVVEEAGRVVFVGYADVRRREGWLIQGVYTFPEARRRGFAALGMQALVEEAFEAGAEHVQLAVIEGNEPGLLLYRSLGFQAFDTLRTILFS